MIILSEDIHVHVALWYDKQWCVANCAWSGCKKWHIDCDIIIRQSVMCKRYDASLNVAFNNFAQIIRWKLYFLTMNAFLPKMLHSSLRLKSSNKTGNNNNVKRKKWPRDLKFYFQKTSGKLLVSWSTHTAMLIFILNYSGDAI